MVYSNKIQFNHPSLLLLRCIGYGLLLLSILDIIALFVPLRLMDPNWELQTLGALVDRVPVPLIGLCLVFYQDLELRTRWEPLVLKILSWSATVVGVLYFLLLPLIVNDTIRVNHDVALPLESQIEQRTAQLNAIEQRLPKVNSLSELKVLAKRLNPAALPSGIQTKSPAEFRQHLLTEIKKAKPMVRAQSEASIADRRLGLMKNGVRFFLSSVVSGFVFLYAGYLTRWARQTPH